MVKRREHTERSFSFLSSFSFRQAVYADWRTVRAGDAVGGTLSAVSLTVTRLTRDGVSVDTRTARDQACLLLSPFSMFHMNKERTRVRTLHTHS